MKSYKSLLWILVSATMLLSANGCKKDEEQVAPEMESLTQGLKSSLAIGYCVSVAVSALKGESLPGNVSFTRNESMVNAGLVTIHFDKNNPLPFNSNVGDVVMAGIWKDNVGLISILFGNFDILKGEVKLYGMDKVPVFENPDNQELITYFEKGDMLLGDGSDTIMNLNSFSDIIFDTKINKLLSAKPTELYFASSKNVWFVNINSKNTPTDTYDNEYTINGGGKILRTTSASGGYIFHAMIDAKVNISACSLNPISGKALIQNFQVDEKNLIDLGGTILNFTNSCNGNASVSHSTGKYSSFNEKEMNLNLN